MKTAKIVLILSAFMAIAFIFDSCNSASDCSKFNGIWIHQEESTHVSSTVEIKENGENYAVTVKNTSEDLDHAFSSTKTITAVCQYNTLMLKEKISLFDIESFTYDEKGDYLVTNKNIIYYKKVPVNLN